METIPAGATNVEQGADISTFAKVDMRKLPLVLRKEFFNVQVNFTIADRTLKERRLQIL